MTNVAIAANPTSATTGPTDVTSICEAIEATVSSVSQVYHYGPEYDNDIFHWASSSTQHAACSFDPATPEDVGIAVGSSQGSTARGLTEPSQLQILGDNRCPFAVKGGGHATNPGFSSTTGVQIAMTKFSEVTYDPQTQTAIIGAGLVWDDVYAALEEYGVTVAGGRFTGVGVAGLTLGGGYSWITNQHGLTIDTVQAYELVSPNGEVVNVTESSDPDLFFALKGGYNNFGIVTRFTLKTFSQAQVWGGTIFYPWTVVDQVTIATANFSANSTDPKAQVIVLYNYGAELVPFISAMLFYDGPTPSPGIFDPFLVIPSLSKDISTRSLVSLVRSFPSNVTEGQRGVFNTISTSGYSVELLQEFASEALYWGTQLSPFSGVLFSYIVEPFLPTIFSHNATPSAYPGSRERGLFPLAIYFGWMLPSSDELMRNATRMSAAKLSEKAISLGDSIPDAPLYNNYAISDTPLERMYGDNLQRLRSIKQEVDPNNVMGLAGGFKF
ncbi:hypothetical protein J3A83DRAFT_4458609 [Scleroderma citrinum]